jgi:hypothetical protein
MMPLLTEDSRKLGAALSQKIDKVGRPNFRPGNKRSIAPVGQSPTFNREPGRARIALHCNVLLPSSFAPFHHFARKQKSPVRN